ncbi:MAG: TIGR02099 family protein, partial [Gammaproteobacteria bacterium]|nr:TIGR02099 family protein [Gammaproteobacteria bacterium]
PRSVWRLSFEQLYIERPHVDVRVDAAGKLHIAGLDASSSGNGETRGADWFFAQREFVIQGGSVRWTDERRNAPALLLTDVQFIARNGGRTHAMRLDATPPEGWGERFSLRGRFRQPLLTVRTGNWRTWDGQLYAELPYVDVARLGQYVSLDARIKEANGALRLWADLSQGELTGGAADLALRRVDTALGKGLDSLVLRDFTGRIAGKQTPELLEVSTTELNFDTADGLRWPGGNLWFQHSAAGARNGERGALRADRLDLAALALIADRLPIGEATRKLIEAYRPRGRVERIDVSWRGPAGAPESYQARGRVSDFGVAAQAGVPSAHPRTTSGTPRPPIGTPGFSAATIDFDASQAGGSAAVAITNGVLDLPGIFEEPVVPLERLSAQLQWKLDGEKAQLQVSDLRFANTDAEGEAQATWRTSDPAMSAGGARFPGVLDLKGQLTRADGTRVFRYLPLEIPKETRDYVRDAVQKGTASLVEFKVKGDLWDMPFDDPRKGDFRIASKVAGVTYAFVPPAAGAKVAWPALTGLSGDLIFERSGMQVRKARGRLVGAPGIEISSADAQIADLAHHAPLLKVDAQAKGPLGELLKVGVPLAAEVGESLAHARATGDAAYKLKLDLPLSAMDKAKVQASIALADNEIQIAPETPALMHASGVLNFTESAFSMVGVQAQALGGAIRLEG